MNTLPDLRDSLIKLLIFILEEFEALKGEIKIYLELLSAPIHPHQLEIVLGHGIKKFI